MAIGKQAEAATRGVLRNFPKFTGKHLSQSLFFMKKETVAQVFSYEFCESFENTYFEEHLPMTASINCKTNEGRTPQIQKQTIFYLKKNII